MELKQFSPLRWLLTILVLSACSKQSEPRKAENKAENSLQEISLSGEQIKNAGIELEAPVRQLVSLEIRVSGLLDVPPQNLHSIGARVPGVVKSTQLLQGAHVHRGEVIAILENPEFLTWQQEYLSAKARLELLETDLARQQELAGKNLSSQKTLQQVQAECKIVRAGLIALRQKLQLNGFSLPEIEKGNFSAELAVRAPDDGFITAVSINTGQVLREGDPICELVNPEHIHAELMVFEKDVARIKEGQDVAFELVADPGHSYRAKVFLVNRKIGKERTVQVHAHPEEHGPDFLPNMQISATIRTNEQQEWTIPEESLVYDGNQPVVFIGGKDAGTFRKMQLKILARQGKRVAVSFPPEIQPESLRLVVKGAYDVKSAFEKATSGEED